MNLPGNPSTEQGAIQLVDTSPASFPASRDEVVANWIAEQWHAEVANRPLANEHRGRLDSKWRQLLERLNVDHRARLGPTHEELLAEQGIAPCEEASEATYTVIGYTTPGDLRRLRDHEDDSLSVEAESCDGCDTPIYAASTQPALAAKVTIHIVRACTSYEGETCLRAFTMPQDAAAFKVECERYTATKPPPPRECVDTPENDAEHVAWWEAHQRWIAQHPGGESAASCCCFDIAELPCFGIGLTGQACIA